LEENILPEEEKLPFDFVFTPKGKNSSFLLFQKTDIFDTII